MLANYKQHASSYIDQGGRKIVQLHADVTVKPSLESIFDHVETALFEQLSKLSQKAGGEAGLSESDVKALASLGDLLTKISRESRLRDESRDKALADMSLEELKQQLGELEDE